MGARLEGTYRLSVDRDGKIHFPKLGPMYVAGEVRRQAIYELPESRREIIPIDLRRIVLDRDPSSDVPLKPMDTLTVYNKSAEGSSSALRR